jgi:hypothetical protein
MLNITTMRFAAHSHLLVGHPFLVEAVLLRPVFRR